MKLINADGTTVLQVGHAVWLYAMGQYYAGEIVTRTRTRYEVQYTSGAGKTRTKWVSETAKNYTGYAPMLPRTPGEEKPTGGRQETLAAKNARTYQHRNFYLPNA